MGKCHWLEMEKAPGYHELNEGLDIIETLYDVRGQNTISLMYCKTCGKFYLKTYIEIDWEGTVRNDQHVFIVPISQNILEELRKDRNKCYNYYNRRRHYVWYTDTTPFWSTNSIEEILSQTYFR